MPREIEGEASPQIEAGAVAPERLGRWWPPRESFSRNLPTAVSWRSIPCSAAADPPYHSRVQFCYGVTHSKLFSLRAPFVVVVARSTTIVKVEKFSEFYYIIILAEFVF